MSEVVEGLRYVIAHRWLILAMVAATVSLLATWGPWETLVPYVIKNELNGGPTALGLVFGAGGVLAELIREAVKTECRKEEA